MFTIEQVLQPETLEEAYQALHGNISNTVLGGCAFLRLGSKKIATAIDLSELKLDYILEPGKEIEIGAMTTFRTVETHPTLHQLFNGVLPKSVSNIIGVQFRNVVTVGATVYSKYGFSDLLTALLALDTEVELYKGGRLPLEEFLQKSFPKDILTRLFIQKNARKASYQSMRNSLSDYPILTIAVSELNQRWRIVVGARPLRAQLASKASEALSNSKLTAEDIEQSASLAVEELSFGSNIRGSAEYRKAMCKVLVKRGIMEVLQCK
ncbi:FAD binding domain-containing protein [Desulforamulus aeronauticus]|uniref:CO or xanthine dehydrogenase, FAD-binding subunit n=1 Tax=Desulforamulus aeronauticus DSM 10349 TaxID=1121421 RepID=A0A1M6NCS7_9FIRM|nr:FAD binding domain-containing protein [Desulforamulus aeronauticus]SHJ93535.1 CO or xanthine dehydrogenase, FAD-binding subunit [Desulforamulus aeronauticus DSM 10349]